MKTRIEELKEQIPILQGQLECLQLTDREKEVVEYNYAEAVNELDEKEHYQLLDDLGIEY